jgi:MSHA pilin protein MshD
VNSERAEIGSRQVERYQAGVTLVELILSITIISIALVGVLLVLGHTTRHSADPMLEHQAVAIAEAYLEEVLLKSYEDPDTGLICGAAEGSRSIFDDVCDYDGLSNVGAEDQYGGAVSGLEGYTVAVSIDTSATLNDLSGSSEVLRADVQVTHPIGIDITISGYRAR